MSWFRVDDCLHSSSKVQSIPARQRLAAMGLWVIAGSWASAQGTDGYVPGHMLRHWRATDKVVESLVNAGLWEHEREGFVFCSWDEYNPNKRRTKDERDADAARKRDERASNKRRTEDESVPNVEYSDPTSPAQGMLSGLDAESERNVSDASCAPARGSFPSRPVPSLPNPEKIKNTSAEAAEASAGGSGDGGDGSAVAAGDGGVVGFSAVPGGGDGEAGPDGEKVSGVSGNGGKSGGKSEGNSGTGSRKNPVRFNYPDDFNSWWSAYPKTKNKSKKNAFTEWKKAVRSVTAEKLLELTEMYAANPGQDDLRFVPDPERWLKGSRWETVADVDADPAASRPSEDPTDPAAWLGLPSGGWSAPWGEDAPAVAPVDSLPVLDADVVPGDGWGDSGPSEPAFWVPTAVPAPSEYDHTERWA